MKRIFHAAALALFCSCSGAGTADPETPPAGNNGGQDKPDVLEAGYYIYTDKETIEADGLDLATFTIKDQDGTVISTEANINSRKIWYAYAGTDTRLDAKSVGFTSVVDGEYEFYGIYGSTKTKNTVKVKVQNRAMYEVFHKNVAMFKITGTWCPNCPSMTSTLEALGDDAKAHSIVLACHWNDDDYSVKYAETNRDLAASAALHVNPNLQTLGAPSNVYDLAIHDDIRTVAGITKIIMQRRLESPATTGIKITSVQMDGTDLKIAASVKASKDGEYDLTCAVLASNVDAGGQGSADGLYHHMVVAINQANFMAVKNETKFTLETDGEYSREFVIPMPAGATSASVLENLSVVVLSLKKDKSGKAIVDNAAECAYGETTDYVYNN